MMALIQRLQAAATCPHASFVCRHPEIITRKFRCSQKLRMLGMQTICSHHRPIFQKSVPFLNSNANNSTFTHYLKNIIQDIRWAQPVRNFSWNRLKLNASKKPLPFEVNTNVAKDTLVFSYKNDRFYKFITVFGLAQYIFWLNLASFSYNGLTSLTEEDLKTRVDENTIMGRMMIYQARYKHKVAAVCIIVGTLVTAFTFFYPQRTIRQLMLLQGGEKVGIQTYSYFGRTRQLTVPLMNLSCQHVRADAKTQLSLKIKNHWFFFLLNQSGGKFHEPKLFDYAIGLQRNLKK